MRDFLTWCRREGLRTLEGTVAFALVFVVVVLVVVVLWKH